MKLKTKKKKPTSYNNIINLVIYPFDVMVSIAETDLELGKKLENHGVDIKNETGWLFVSDTNNARTVVFSGNQTLIRLKYIPVTPEQKGELAHEIAHAVFFFCERIGLQLVPMTSCEAYTYMIQYLTKEIYKTIDGKR
ncbi:MAG TPA: hypothetical protein VE933_04155 [Chitinophagaceae bacterium]|nr:hypothetical protein [Chitinophagaceae bacterium]